MSISLRNKKNATRWSRAKSTPKEEGGGDKRRVLELSNIKALKLNPLWASQKQKSRTFCATHH